MSDYGVKNYNLGDQESNTSIAKLGNGKIRVQALGFEGGCAGICIVDDNTHVEPYSSYHADELPNDATEVDSDKVIIMATNKRSIQVLIDRLTEAKEFLED